MLSNAFEMHPNARLHSKVQADNNSQDSIILDSREHAEPIISKANPAFSTEM